MKLYLIGNGFDCYLHRMPTQYNDFRSYIVSKFPGCEEYSDLVPSGIMMPKGDIRYDEEEVAGYIVSIIDSCGDSSWASLEEYLGEDIFNEFDWNLQDVNLEEEKFNHAVYNNEYISNDILYSFRELKSLFQQWVDEELAEMEYHSNGKAESVIDDGLFFTFNYTRTLEEAYGIPPEFVCHIHGVIGSDVVLGHGDDREIEEHFSSWGSEQSFSELKRCLRKDTKRAISSHSEFFEKLGKVTQIYSYGFSFAAVDMVYIDEICKHIDPEKTVWWFNTYTWENEQELVEKIRQYGFLVKHEKRW